MRPSPQLLAFAFVKETLDRTGDYVEGLAPLFAPVIAIRRGQDFNPGVFAKDVNDFYGIQIRPEVAEDWAERLARANLLEVVEKGDNYVRYRNVGTDYKKSPDSEVRINSLLDGLAEHIRKGMTELGFSITDTEIDSAILARLIQFDSARLLSASDRPLSSSAKLSLPKRGKKGAPSERPTEDEATERDNREEQLDFLFANFAMNQRARGDDSFRALTDVAAGAMVSEIVLGLRSPPTKGQDASKLSVILDSPILLDLLDLTNDEAHEFIVSLIDDLRKMKAHVCTFAHIVDEVRGVLTAVLRKFRNGVPVGREIGRRFATDVLSITRAIDAWKDLRGKLEGDFSISIIDADASEFWDKTKYFKPEHERNLTSLIRPYDEFESRAVDAKSVASVLRWVLSDRPVANVFSLPAALLTKNQRLVNTGLTYARRNRVYDEDYAPPLLTDRYMAGLVWVALGGEGKDIPVRQLLAHCASAVIPRRDVIEQMRAVLSKIGPQQVEEFEALLLDDRCAYYLMDLTHGNRRVITSENATALLESIREETAGKVRDELLAQTAAKLEELRRELDDSWQKIVDKKQADLDRINEISSRQEEELESIRRQNMETARRLEALEGDRASQNQNLVGICLDYAEKRAFRIGVGVFAVIYLISALASATTNLLFAFALNRTTLLIVWNLIALVILGATAFAQFWWFPDFLFGSFMRRIRETEFRRRAERMISGDTAELVVDWSVRPARLVGHTGSTVTGLQAPVTPAIFLSADSQIAPSQPPQSSQDQLA